MPSIDQARSQQPLPGAHREDLTEQRADRGLVGGAEPGDRGVVGLLVGRDHPERHVLGQSPLDPSTGPLTDAVGVDQHGQHHRRVIRCAASAIGAVAGVEPGQVELGAHIENEPRQVILGKPVRHRRRHQHQLLTIGSHEVVRHIQFSVIHSTRPPHETRSSRRFVRQPLRRRIWLTRYRSARARPCQSCLTQSPCRSARGWRS